MGQVPVDLTGKRAITYVGTPLVAAGNVRPGESAVGLQSPSTSSSTGYIEFASWSTNTPTASVLLFHRRSSTANNGLARLQWNGDQNHYPFGGLYYLNDFWGARWQGTGGGESFPSGKTVTLPHVYVSTIRDGEQRAYIDGDLWTSNTLAGNYGTPATMRLLGNSGFAGFDGELYAAFMWSRFLGAAEVKALSSNPWQLFAPLPRRIWAPAGGAATHTTTGALASGAAVIAGTAAHLTLHATSGALSAQASTVAGTATHLTLHTTTGALSAAAATISGTAAHHHATTGALSAQVSTLAGTAAHLTLHTSTGALSAAASTVAGTAAHHHATTGALSSDAATIAGAADHTVPGTTHATSGALSAQASTVAGTATHLTLHATSGALSAAASTIAGTAVHPHTTTGALSAQAASLAGTAAHEHASTGALSSGAATIAGAADHTAAGTHDATGDLQAGDASMSGEALVLSLFGGGGWPVLPQKKRTRKELLDERIEIEYVPQPVIEALAPAVQTKVRKAGTITLRALIGSDTAASMSLDLLQTEMDNIQRRTKAVKHRQRLMREDEELMLL